MGAVIQPPAEQARAEVTIAEELRQTAYEPLLPVEQKLIIWCLALGVLLLMVLAYVCSVVFKA